MKRRSLERVAESDVTVARNLLSMTTTNLRHAEDHMLLLGRKTSLERVAAFLIEMDRRSTAAGVLALPMCRRDIAIRVDGCSYIGCPYIDHEQNSCEIGRTVRGQVEDASASTASRRSAQI